ncbi:MAG: ureidoglycolate lyase [Candidatus Hermodarchaeia archaeon]|jgi:ureidoglycolate lyase
MDVETIEIRLEPISAEIFAPFGEIIEAKSSEPRFSGKDMDSWKLQFSIDGATALTINRFYYKPLEFSRMERHFHVTQSFLPFGKIPMVMVVSEPTDFDRSSIPKPADICAFYLDGTQGIMLWKGTWHALHRFPLNHPYVDLGLITEMETQSELESAAIKGTKLKRTQKIDYEQLLNLNFKVVDPLNLIGPD